MKVPEILINLFPSSKVAFKVPITVKFPEKDYSQQAVEILLLKKQCTSILKYDKLFKSAMHKFKFSYISFPLTTIWFLLHKIKIRMISEGYFTRCLSNDKNFWTKVRGKRGIYLFVSPP